MRVEICYFRQKEAAKLHFIARYSFWSILSREKKPDIMSISVNFETEPTISYMERRSADPAQTITWLRDYFE